MFDYRFLEQHSHKRFLLNMIIPSKEHLIHLQYKIAVNRNEKAYKELFLHFHQPLIAFSFLITKSKEASEEIFSDVFMKIWSMGAELNNIEHLKVYLYKCMKNASLNYLAKSSRRAIIDIDSLPFDNLKNETTPENLLTHQELKESLSKAISSLPLKCGMVFKLIKEENLSYKQVAEILSISVNTIEGHMTTALKKISYSLQRYNKQ